MDHDDGLHLSDAGRRGADLLLDVLRSEGVTHVFGNPGTTELPLLDAIAGADGMSYVLGLQEASVVAMADGFAQASGRPGFANLHTAGALGHAMGAVVNATASRTPLVITAGQQNARQETLDPLLSGDAAALAAPFTKWSRTVARVEDIPIMVRRAFQDAASAPTSPVFLSLPVDVLLCPTRAEAGRPSRIDRGAVAGSLAALHDALAAIPLGRLALVAGDEVFRSDAGDEVVRLAEALAAPVYAASWPSHFPFPTAHPLWAGTLPTTAPAIGAALGAFDAVLLLGGHSFITHIDAPGWPVPPGCKLFQLSADATALGRIFTTDLSCVGDLRASLLALLAMVERDLAPRQAAVSDLRSAAARLRTSARDALRGEIAAALSASPMTSLAAVAEVVRAVGPSVPLVDEAPSTMRHVQACLDSPSWKQYYFMRGATLGWGMPAAVGVSLGLDRSPAVCIVGDGSALYSPQALWSAASESLPVTFVVMNNGAYGMVRDHARRHPAYRHMRSNRTRGLDLTDPPIDFVALATAFGVPAHRVTRAADMAGAVEAGIASGRASLIDVVIGAG